MDLLKKNKEKILKIIEEIKQLNDSGVPIMVEGMKDKESLETLGVRKNIITVSRKKIFKIGDLVANEKKVIILTDFDKRGRELAYKLQNELMERGVNPNLTVWRKLRFYLKKSVKDIEKLGDIIKELNGV